MNRFKDKYKKRAENDSVLTAVSVILVFLMCVFFPLPFKNRDVYFVFSLLIRFLFSGAAIFLVFSYGFYDNLRLKRQSKASMLVFFSALVLAVSNFPIFEALNGGIKFDANASKIVIFIFYCISVALFEELFFRGLVLPLFLIRFKRFKLSGVMAIVVSSALFGAVHLLNVFGGASIGAAFLQVGYTFLVGLLCGAVYLVSKTIILPVIVHLVYNLGGLLLSFEIISGEIWSVPSIVFMSIAAVLSAAVCIFFVLKQELKLKEQSNLG